MKRILLTLVLFAGTSIYAMNPEEPVLSDANSRLMIYRTRGMGFVQAAQHNNVDLAKVFLQLPIKVNFVYAGRTALHWAAENGSVELVKALLAKNADTTILDYNDDTALQLAERNNHPGVIALLKKPTSSQEQ